MKYLLDTNIIAYIINERPPEVISKFLSLSKDEIFVSSIVVAELWYGVVKSHKKEQNKTALEEFLAPLTIVDFDFTAAKFYGLIRADLEAKGLIIGSNDILIAAHALSLGLTLVTNNTKEFGRVIGLKLENWVE
ncbi:type II toxin-antitoxin system tRNA(fMet)-specific endonuclease VapC [Dyadobacter frigoris]|uniref:Ribonuclease VapC n=1 Tax=Dyadobacter frigoris TaxID=2576211 RepID=A0A4U6D047_9BACT|nr:type II toxin-antitoxin system VapC family toxin [Dyadobacter frigoris]TKT89575.1 type II toxin-antitoxin system VapC family toxin [Dyadobacter frigoris]GLU54211.1 ribonuclease VapC [Dyadobacter frigoris]